MRIQYPNIFGIRSNFIICDNTATGGVSVQRTGGEGQVSGHQRTESHPHHHLHPCWPIRVSVSNTEEDPDACALRCLSLHGDQLTWWFTVLWQASPFLHAQEVPAGLSLSPPSSTVSRPPVHHHPAHLLRHALAHSNFQTDLNSLSNHAPSACWNQETSGFCLYSTRAESSRWCLSSK